MTQLKNLMISVSGVRGIVGDGLTPEVALKFAQAYGSEFGPGKIVVGRDSRVTGEMVKNAVIAGLLSVGCDAVDIGIVPTPTTELSTERPANSGGIIITASHNPKEWNALKLLAPDGLFLNAEQGEKILERVKNDDYNFVSWDKIGKSTTCILSIERHINATLALPLIDVPTIMQKQFTVVADCCNGAGGTILPSLLKAMGCKTIFLNQEPNGLFPRNPEPTPAHLSELCQAVKTHKADLGIAVDPDVDRLALVNEKGEPMSEELTLALTTEYIVSKTPGNVVVNASTSRIIDDIAKKYNSQVYRTPVGEIHVATKAREIKAVMAGEGNGGVIYPELHLGRDAIIGIALVLQYMTESGKTISQIQDGLPKYTMIKDKIALPFDVNAKLIVQKLHNAHKQDNIDTIDGVKILYEKSWVHIRASNTEPIIRVIAESPTQQETQSLIDAFKNEIIQLSNS